MKSIKLIFSCLCVFIMLLVYVTFLNSDDKTLINPSKNIDNAIDYKRIIKNLKQEYNNEDIVGVLEIPNTEINIPVVQTTNNDYYLNHTINKEESYKGAIFLDYRVDINTSKKLLIYGHSYDKEHFPFNILENYYDENYCKNNKYIEITTSTNKKIYEIFSVYVETTDFSYMNTKFIDNEEFLKHIENLKSKSIYDTNISLKEDDEILILQTCSNNKEYSDYSKKYLLIISRRIK